MKITSWLLGGAALLFLAACESPSPGGSAAPGTSTYSGPAPTYTQASASPAAHSRVAAAAADPTHLPPRDAQMLYQRRSSDAFGSSTFTSGTQIRGPVEEQVYIGNQRVDGPDGMVRILDPRTGRMITVSRP